MLDSAFFDIGAEAPQNIEFYIRQKFFAGTDEKPFNAQTIFNHINNYMKKRYSDLDTTFSPDASGGKFVIKFPAPIERQTDVERLIDIIDDMAFAYVAAKRG